MRAIDYYALSLNPASSFIGYQCPNYDLFKQGWCSLSPKNIMGYYSNPKIPGKFYVEISYALSSFDEQRNFLYNINRIGSRVFDILTLNF